MLVAVILRGDLDLFPSHVQIRLGPTPFVADRDLRLRPREPGVDQQHPQPALFGRLGAAVDQCQRRSGRLDVMPTAVAVHEQLDVRHLQLRRLHQGVGGGDRHAPGMAARQVKRGARRCGDRHAGDDGDLVGLDALLPNPHPAGVTAIGVDDLGRPRRVDPLRTVQRGGRETRQHAAPARPQPCRLRPHHRRQLGVASDMPSRCSATYRLRNSWRDSNRAPRASLPRKGSVMAKVCCATPTPWRARNATAQTRPDFRPGVTSGASRFPGRSAEAIG
ncbi:hypothetical protein MAP_1208 [Mycobacterium avium subsp. paratuberculosis K-10]|uniref:Uncharacterized protein n=1 Tax=Mycolicibacterium paratuberculosis (strain ATCC BAA-968 / K-10) TaxID=262316 RepID=Q740Y4_MYCPA|nr:hypothetical protein MAP_1208 [Mycobacterium avium subsp. paratuberculosis K-10]AGL37531.1 hypothetical protein MAP4_2645 [Mycobacterium avium subsp. paratuberculosis MAP4]